MGHSLHLSLGLSLATPPSLTVSLDAMLGEAWSTRYNFDVVFAGQKYPVGVNLQMQGERTNYNAAPSPTASEGTWFFLMAT